jgi:glutaredoxin 3
MQKVLIYTTPYCPFCLMAKRLLTKKGAAFQEIDVSGNPDLRAEMRRKAGGLSTVPQIWIGDRHVGGCDELYALEQAGKLDALLAG